MHSGHEVLEKLGHLKGNFQHLWEKLTVSRHKSKSKRKIENVSFGSDDVDTDDEIDSDQNFYDDLPLTLNHDSGPGVKYYDTENSQFANHAMKVIPQGIDSFGEEDTFDPDEADEHQTYRDRNQN